MRARHPGREPYAKTPPPERDAAGRRRYSPIRSFTRRGDRMSPALAHTFAAHRDEYLLEFPREIGTTTVATDVQFSPAEAFGREAQLVVEVGCGTGTQIVAAAAEHPDRNYLGFEVWLPGLAKVVSGANNLGGLGNLKVVQADAAQALEVLLEPGSVAEFWTFFPDPWPKARHRKRRLVSNEFAGVIARLLAPGGIWRLATDFEDYAWQMRDVIESTPGLVNAHAGERPEPDLDPAGGRGGFAPRWEGRVVTTFEARAQRDGRVVRDLTARKA